MYVSQVSRSRVKRGASAPLGTPTRGPRVDELAHGDARPRPDGEAVLPLGVPGTEGEGVPDPVNRAAEHLGQLVVVEAAPRLDPADG